ncbi:MAG: serine/threonine-protein phosphatase [Sedimentisphaerales bacterium]|nr:serine/threonine-protein phosphatase [Sedimentisphaerales bacterium]
MNNWTCLIVNSENQSSGNIVAAAEKVGISCQIKKPEQAMDILKNRESRFALVIYAGLELNWPDVIEQELISLCEKKKSTVLVCSSCEEDYIRVNAKIVSSEPRLFVSYANINESVEMLAGRLGTLLEMNNWHVQNRIEIERLKMVGQPLSEHFNEVTEEMHLASRLQRDFLPRELPELPGVRFGAVYRPATWVSGDIYDVMRLDENNFAFYVADAVGHGMPAALLTMFIKRAIVPKRINGKSYELVPPGEILCSLNEDMCLQGLSDQQFATCCYGIMNFKERKLTLANAGHPYPMLMKPDGTIGEFRVKGPLLGVIDGAEYVNQEFSMEIGDKLLVYSDGVEAAFETQKVSLDSPPRFREQFAGLNQLPVDDLVRKLLYLIDDETGSLHPRDDVTVVGIELYDK